jgi:ABC-2 type transport system permease protein
MSIRRVLALAGRIIRQFTRDRRTMALLFIVPLLIMTLLHLILNGNSNSVTLGVVPPSGMDSMVDQLKSQASSQSTLTLKIIARGDVESTLKDGNADGILIFPDDYVAQALSGEKPELTLRLEGSDPNIARQLKGSVAMLINNFKPQGISNTSTASLPSPNLTTSYLYGGSEYTATDALAPLFIGLFSFFFVFLLTSVAFLRERSQGTIERVLVAPMTRTELVMGYVIGFTIFALLQSLVILLYVVGILRVHYAGNLLILFLITALLTIGGVNMGIFASAFARNELQVIQFIPLFIVPQIFLGGLFFPVSTLPVVLKQIAYVMPLTYANFALKDVMLRGFGIESIVVELVFLLGFAIVMIMGAAFSLRQEHI